MATKKEEIVAKLTETRAQLESFFAELDEGAWETAVYHEDTTWHMSDILRHLADSERGMTNMITQWQQGNDPIPADFDLARWNNRVIQKTAEKSPEELLTELQTNRSNLLAVLEGLETEDWEKRGRHASLRIMSIEEVCHLIADHEIDHLHVMQATLANG